MTRILVLPGIGDIYWVMTMLQDFMRQRQLTDVEVSVWDFDGRRRSAEYVERIPFVKSGGYFHKPPHPHRLPMFRDSYWTGDRSIIPDQFGFDYYIAVNGALRHGRTIADASGCKVNWYPDYIRTPRDERYEQEFVKSYGKYVLLHLSSFGMFKPWVAAWPAEKCAEFVTLLQKRTGLLPILSGSSWDQPWAEQIADLTGAVCNAGMTDADQFFGLLHGATAVAGWCGGNTILATTLHKPTLMLWSEFFPDDRFFYNACPPDAWEKWYMSHLVERVTPQIAVEDFCRMMQC